MLQIHLFNACKRFQEFYYIFFFCFFPHEHDSNFKGVEFHKIIYESVVKLNSFLEHLGKGIDLPDIFDLSTLLDGFTIFLLETTSTISVC